MKAIEIHPDGTIYELDYETFEDLRSAVGGYVTVINLLSKNGKATMLVDEDGYAKRLNPNPTANIIAGVHAENIPDYVYFNLVGTAVITGEQKESSVNEKQWTDKDFTTEDYNALMAYGTKED